MYKELFQYILHHKQLPVPGVGTFLLERRSAAIDFPGKIVQPPVYSIGMKEDSESPADNFFIWIGNALHISPNDAITRFNDFAGEIKSRINNGDTIDWKGVGIISKGLADTVKFSPSTISSVNETPVSANKVLREKSDHMVRVGEDERTSAEMTDYFTQPEARKSYWWAASLIIGLVATVFIGWYLSENGVTIISTGNNTKLVPQEASVSYKTLP